jgi:transposase-like protein
MPTRPAMFKWRQTEPELILCAVHWYLRYSLGADHTTVWRWLQRYGCLRSSGKPQQIEDRRCCLEPLH